MGAVAIAIGVLAGNISLKESGATLKFLYKGRLLAAADGYFSHL
jgi:hypothetical protein